MEYGLSSQTGVSGLFGSGLPLIFKRVLGHLKDHVVPHPRNSYRPHVLHSRALGLFSLLLLSVKVSALVATSFIATSPALSSAITIDNIYSLTNQSRKAYGAAPLVYNEVLQKAAQAKADDMLAKGYFAHTSPSGKSPWEFIKAAGYAYITAGENLAVDFSEAESVDDAWMNSPGHKANIINKNFEDIGIGISQGQFEGHNAIFVVQMFGTQTKQPVTLKNEPTVVQKKAPAKTAAKPGTGSSPAETASLPAPEELKILSSDVKLENNFVRIEVKTSSSASRVMALFGGKAAMLRPLENGTWTARLPVPQVRNQAISVIAYDISGSKVSEQVANFTGGLLDTYNLVGDVKGETITLFGRTFDPGAVAQQFYLIFAAAILTCLVVAIAVHRHVQHVPMIANSSFVVILAVLLFAM